MPAPAVSRAPQVTKLLSALPRAKDTTGFGKIQAGLEQVADQVRTRRARPPRPAKAAGPRGARAPADARSSPSQMGSGEEGHAATLMAQLLGGLDKALGFSTSPKGRQLDADDDALYSVLAALTAGAQRLSKSKKSAKLLVSDVAPAVAAQFHHLLSVALSSDYHIEAREVALEFVSVPPPTAADCRRLPPPPAASRRLPPPPAAPRRARPPRAPPTPQEVCKCSATIKDGGDKTAHAVLKQAFFEGAHAKECVALLGGLDDALEGAESFQLQFHLIETVVLLGSRARQVKDALVDKYLDGKTLNTKSEFEENVHELLANFNEARKTKVTTVDAGLVIFGQKEGPGCKVHFGPEVMTMVGAKGVVKLKCGDASSAPPSARTPPAPPAHLPRPPPAPTGTSTSRRSRSRR